MEKGSSKCISFVSTELSSTFSELSQEIEFSNNTRKTLKDANQTMQNIEANFQCKDDAMENSFNVKIKRLKMESYFYKWVGYSRRTQIKPITIYLSQ